MEAIADMDTCISKEERIFFIFYEFRHYSLTDTFLLLPKGEGLQRKSGCCVLPHTMKFWRQEQQTDEGFSKMNSVLLWPEKSKFIALICIVDTGSYNYPVFINSYQSCSAYDLNLIPVT